MLAIDARPTVEHPGDPEHQVVASLVGKQERGGLRKEVRGVAESPNVQASIVRLKAPWYDRIGSA